MPGGYASSGTLGSAPAASPPDVTHSREIRVCGNGLCTFPVSQLPSDNAVYVLVDSGVSSETVFGLASNPAQKKGDFAFPKVKRHINSHCCLSNRVNVTWKVLESGPLKTRFHFVSEEAVLQPGNKCLYF